MSNYQTKIKIEAINKKFKFMADLKTKTEIKEIENLEPITAVNWFYDEIERLKEQLPQNPQKLILKELPKAYDSFEGARLINGVINKKTTDMRVLNAIELVVSKIIDGGLINNKKNA